MDLRSKLIAMDGRSAARLRTVLAGAFFLALVSCGASVVNVVSEDLQGLASDDLKALQFYSGKQAIVFAAEVDEVIREVDKATLSTTKMLTEHRLTIPKKTPGEVFRFDPISLELLLRFDPDLPVLTYQDLGDGLELVTNEVVLDGVTYARVLISKRNRRGMLRPEDRRYLAVRKRDKTKREKNRKKAAGVKKPKN